MTKKHT